MQSSVETIEIGSEAYIKDYIIEILTFLWDLFFEFDLIWHLE